VIGHRIGKVCAIGRLTDHPGVKFFLSHPEAEYPDRIIWKVNSDIPFIEELIHTGDILKPFFVFMHLDECFPKNRYGCLNSIPGISGMLKYSPGSRIFSTGKEDWCIQKNGWIVHVFLQNGGSGTRGGFYNRSEAPHIFQVLFLTHSIGYPAPCH
jgi:hypothetical protein